MDTYLKNLETINHQLFDRLSTLVNRKRAIKATQKACLTDNLQQVRLLSMSCSALNSSIQALSEKSAQTG